MTANIYYSSTAFSDIFKNNSRSSFKANIDPSFFSHLNIGNLYAAVKSITFDNSYNAVVGELKVPHLLIIEKNTQPINYIAKWLKEGKYQNIGSAKNWNDPEAKIELNLESGKDYLFFNFNNDTLAYDNEEISSTKNEENRGQQLFGINRDSERGFTNLQILCSNFIIQAIYMHSSDFGDSSNLVQFINRAYQTIWFESDLEKKEDKLIFKTVAGRCMFRNTTTKNIMVYIHSSIAEILGFTKLQAIKQVGHSRKIRSSILSSSSMEYILHQRKIAEQMNEENEDEQEQSEQMIFLDDDIMPNIFPIDDERNPEECARDIERQIKREHEHKHERERIFTKYLNPEELGKINFISSKNIKEMLTISSKLDISYNPLLPLLKSFFNNDLEWNYYYIAENTSVYYVLSKEIIDIVKIKPQMIGLFASYSTADIYNSTYNKIVAYINNADRKYGVSHIEIRNPTYYHTSIEKLCKSELTLIDINTGLTPFFATGTPTYIQVHLKIDRGMAHKQFNIFLDSSDIVSKKYFPTNTNTDFRIQLPQWLEFNRKWQVCLKSIFLGNDFFNIYENKCSIKCEIQLSSQIKERIIYIKLPSGIYKTIEDITKKIHELFLINNIDVSCKLKENIVQFNLKTQFGNYIKWNAIISPYLSSILGLDRNTALPHTIDFTKKRKFKAVYESRIYMLVPQNYVVMTDVVKATVFGSDRVNVLKMLSTRYDSKQKIVHFEHIIDEFVSLNITEFSDIRIKIADSTGEILQTSELYPTRLQLQFSV